MKAWQTLATVDEPGIGPLSLHARDGEIVIRVRGRTLMSSFTHGSESAMARAGLPGDASRATVLVGGLGLGFTARAVLDLLGPQGVLDVAELSTAVIGWNRDLVGHLAGRPLADPRTSLFAGDVRAAMRARPGAYDAVLLDVDNGPSALTRDENAALYGAQGLREAWAALRPGGVWVVWSAKHDERFLGRMRAAGFDAEARPVAAHGTKGKRYVLFVGRRKVR